MSIINNNFNPNEGIIVVDNSSYQHATYSSGIATPNDGIFTNKYDIESDIYAANRHRIDHAWETNNIYFLKNSTVVKTNFKGEILATSITLNNPSSICINQRMIVPSDPNDYIEESGCFVVGVDADVASSTSSSSSSKSDSSSSISNNVYLKIFDNQLNLISDIILDTTFQPGEKIHIIPEFTGSNVDYDTFKKFAIIYLKKGSNYLWHIDYFNISESKVIPCKAIMSENYCLNGGYSYCFPMDDRTPAFIYNSKLWVVTSRIEYNIDNFTREKIRVFDLSGTSPTGLLEKTIDPLEDMFGVDADYSVLSDIDINYSVPNFVLVTGGCQYYAWVARYGNSGNFINKLDASTGGSIDFPKAIKCVQSPISTFFYLLAEDNSDYFPEVCDFSSSSSLSDSSLSEVSSSSTSADARWIISNEIYDFTPRQIAYSGTGTIYVAGHDIINGSNARVYKSTDRMNFTDITPYTELVANFSSDSSTWPFGIKCNYSGEYILLGIVGDDPNANALLSKDYGNTWEFINTVGYYTAFRIIQASYQDNLFSISDNGEKMAIRAGSYDGYQDILLLNNNYGSGNWTSYDFNYPEASQIYTLFYEKSTFIGKENTDEIINTFYNWDDITENLVNFVFYSPDFGETWINLGGVSGLPTAYIEYNEIMAMDVSNDLSQAIVSVFQQHTFYLPYSYSYDIYLITNLKTSPTATYIGYNTHHTVNLICNNNCSRMYYSYVDAANTGYGVVQRGIENISSWAYDNIFKFDDKISIPQPQAIAGVNNLANVCIASDYQPAYYLHHYNYSNVYSGNTWCRVTSR